MFDPSSIINTIVTTFGNKPAAPAPAPAPVPAPVVPAKTITAAQAAQLPPAQLLVILQAGFTIVG